MQNGGNDTRLSSRQQQLHPKAATLEASSTSSHARLAVQAARTTKEERERVFEANRKDEVPSDEQPVGGEACGLAPAHMAGRANVKSLAR